MRGDVSALSMSTRAADILPLAMESYYDCVLYICINGHFGRENLCIQPCCKGVRH